MAGTRFDKQVFIEATMDRYARLIAEQEEIVSTENALTDAEKIDAWRERETNRVCEFAQRLIDGAVEDHELEHFEIKRVPDVGRVNWSSESYAERQVQQLRKSLEKILVYVRSLAEVEPGIIEVSAADLKRIGYGL